MATTTLPDLRVLLGDSILGELVGLPLPSIARTSAATMTPEVVGRIGLIGQVVWCLQGTYDDEGIRRWFGRHRPQLKGASPIEHLGTDWLASSPSAKQVLDLARELTSTG
jgi:hypothetical protein